MDAASHLYVLDAAGREVLEVAADKVVRRIALPRAAPAAFTARSRPLEDHMSFPAAPGQLCVTGAGQVFVADSGNDRVQVFTAAP